VETIADSTSLASEKRPDFSDSAVIVSDTLVKKTYESWTLAKFKGIYQPKKINSVIYQNKYEQGKKDTLYSFNEGGDSVKFYVSPVRSFLYRLVITSGRVTIDNYFKVGMDKALLNKYFKTDHRSDVIAVEDMAGFTRFTFYFEDEKLTKFAYRVNRME